MKKFNALGVEKTIKISSIAANSVKRSLLPRIVMGNGRHSTPTKVEANDSAKTFWDVYYERKSAYEKITCDIKAIDLLNKNWVRIPTLVNSPFNWTHTFTNNLFPTQTKSSQTDFCTVTEGTCIKLTDTVKNNAVDDATGLDKSTRAKHDLASIKKANKGQDPNKSATKKADTKDHDFLDEQIILEEKRINGLLHKNIHPVSNLKDLFNTNIFRPEDNDSYQRFYDIIDNIDVDNAMQVHDVRKKDDKKEILENSKKRDGLVHNPSRPDAAEQPVLEETESAEVWQPLNSIEVGKSNEPRKNERINMTNIQPIEDKNELLKEPKISKKAAEDSKTDICKILAQAVDLFIDVLGDNKGELGDNSTASQEKPIEASSLSQLKPLEIISVDQEKSVETTSVSQEKTSQALSVSQEKPIETASVSQVKPLVTATANQVKPIRNLCDDQEIHQEKPLQPLNLEQKPLETSFVSQVNCLETIGDKQEKSLQALSANQEKPLDTPSQAVADNQEKHLETPGDTQENPLQASSLNKGKLLDSPSISQGKPLQIIHVDQEKPVETPNVSEDQPLQAQSLNLSSFETESVSQVQCANQEKHLESQSEGQINPVQALSVGQEKILETPSESQEKPQQIVSVIQEKSLQAVSVNQDNHLETQSVSQEKPFQAPSVNQEKSLETPSVNQEKPLKALSVNEEKSLLAPSVSQEKPSETPSASQEKPLETPSVIQVKSLGTLNESEQKALQDASVKEEKPLETASVNQEKSLDIHDVKVVKKEENPVAKIEEITPNIAKEEKPLITESVNASDSNEKNFEIEIKEKDSEGMLNKVINTNQENLMKIELPANTKLTGQVRTLIIENKLPVKVRE